MTDQLCENCQQNRIMGGRQVHTFHSDKAGEINLHAQCVGRWLIAHPAYQLFYLKSDTDPSQIDIEDEEDEQED